VKSQKTKIYIGKTRIAEGLDVEKEKTFSSAISCSFLAKVTINAPSLFFAFSSCHSKE
jgi:hypothetical protein